MTNILWLTGWIHRHTCSLLRLDGTNIRVCDLHSRMWLTSGIVSNILKRLSVAKYGRLSKGWQRVAKWGNVWQSAAKDGKVQGVPKKTPLCVQRLLEVLKSYLQIKVGWVLKNSGNFQSNEHRNFVFSPKNVWDIKAQSWLPSP